MARKQPPDALAAERYAAPPKPWSNPQRNYLHDLAIARAAAEERHRELEAIETEEESG